MSENTSDTTRRTISLPQPDAEAQRLTKYQHQTRCFTIAMTCGGIALLLIGAKLAVAIYQEATR